MEEVAVLYTNGTIIDVPIKKRALVVCEQNYTFS